MKWFEGSIPDAIQTARQKHALFIVYISGEDDLSKNMDETWEDETVTKIATDSNCVALKLKASSQACVQFSEIYHVICVPSTYFIGDDGKPLEITGGPQTPPQFTHTLESVVLRHRSTPEGATASSSSAETNENAATVSKEEKVQRAQELLNQKRLEKSEKEEKEKLEKEKERIEVGKQMTKFKQWKEEKNAEEIKDQIKKDKLEAKQARERVRAQIEQDRADRAARYNREKSEKETLKQEKLNEKLRQEQETAAVNAAQKSLVARIQFRLPDGSSVTQHFPSDDSLSTARLFISQRIGVSNVSLSTMFPRRTFTDDEMSDTFRNLGLAPSAAIIVIPSSSAVSRPSGGAASIVTMILAPFIAIWTFLYSLLFGRQHSPVNQPGSSSVATPPPSTDTTATGGVRRRQGRLHDLRPDGDDNATWNGNSTQQM
ncbi:UBX domain-containing protein 4-like [Tubulanus polymorphus]|uniref:UBX domain-containing protein 4-like n=1 Tax=Tubulanus polymorphus TaxID=672921 RepID=UPI003DA3E0CB